ncbi:hypothetical protein [Primorskyibacter sp. S87]|uniref:hypothetical protein n=1 Tax=Primorskyibacter sp. S87 TaxID=3415126 RepID=UPI003C7AB25B
MIRPVLVLAAALSISAPAQSQTLGLCKDSWIGLSQIGDSIVGGRNYANGNVKLGVVDTGGEPVCCSQHLVVTVPHPERKRQCFILSANDQAGFWGIDVSKIISEYDPAKGLLLRVPVASYDPDTGGIDRSTIRAVPMRINQATGVVKLEQKRLKSFKN